MHGHVALTGASGFIGSAILKELVEHGYKVNALTRKPQPKIESVNWIQGGLDDESALKELSRDAIAIIHCAGQVRGNSLETFTKTNVEGTVNLVSAAMEQTNRCRFLFISSLAARQPELSWYAKSKQMAELSLEEYKDNMQITIFRPTAVYGPGDKEIKPIFDATRHGVLPVVGKATNRFSLLHVDDFVSAIRCWLETNSNTNGTFEICDNVPEGYSYQSLAAISQEIWRRPVRCIFIPISMVHIVANTNLWLSRLLQYAPMLTPGKVKELQHPNWLCDNEPLMRAIPSWRPSIKLHQALPLLCNNT